MFKDVYNRCKLYLNSYATFGTIFIILILLIVPTFEYKSSNGFFSNISYACQNTLVIRGVLLLYIYTIWSYLKKYKNNVYQTHRYGNVKLLIRNNICDVLFLGLTLETTFLLLNATAAMVFNDGYYFGLYKYYNISNLSYLTYLIIIRYIIVSLVSIIVYFIFHTDKKVLKLILFLLIGLNIMGGLGDYPITFFTLLSGYKFKSFTFEIIYVTFLLIIYIFGLIIVKKKFINKKRDL